jgi:hypothetical protein
MAIWYLDPALGASGNTGKGFWSCAYTAGTHTQPPVDESQTMTGVTSSRTAVLVAITVTSGTWAGGDAAGVLSFKSKSGTFTAAEIGNFTNGSHCVITADLAVAARQFTENLAAGDLTAGDTIRMARTPAPISIGNATWTDGSGTVTLDTAITKNIDLCVAAGTGENQWDKADANVSISGESSAKEGTYRMAIAIGASFATDTLIAWADLPDSTASDFGTYTGISFWISANAAINANTLRLRLYSAVNGGGSVLEDYLIPYKIESGYVKFYPVNTRNDASPVSLSSTRVRSIGLYAEEDPGTVIIYIDNIFAHNGLSLQSLISKHTSGTNEPWFTIRSISGTTITLGGCGDYGSMFAYYYTDDADSSPETVDTFRRETVKTTLCTTSSGEINKINKVGTFAAPLLIYGGYDTTTGVNTAAGDITFLDGFNGFGCGFVGASNYGDANHTIKKIGLARYYYGIGGHGGRHYTLEDMYFAGNSNGQFCPNGYCVLTRCYIFGVMPLSPANALTELYDCKVTACQGGYGTILDGPMIMNNCVFGGFYSSATYGDIYMSNPPSNVFAVNCRFKVALPVVGSAAANYSRGGVLFSLNHNRVSGSNYFYTPYYRGSYLTFYAFNDTTIYKTASPSMRLVASHATYKAESAPLNEGVEAAVAASGDFTISVWIRKSNTTTGDGFGNDAATYNGNAPRLICRRNDVMGVTADTVIATLTGGAGAFAQMSGSLSGASIVPSQDGVLEFIVDCDGTAGWINIDDWAVA